MLYYCVFLIDLFKGKVQDTSKWQAVNIKQTVGNSSCNVAFESQSEIMNYNSS